MRNIVKFLFEVECVGLDELIREKVPDLDEADLEALRGFLTPMLQVNNNFDIFHFCVLQFFVGRCTFIWGGGTLVLVFFRWRINLKI